MTDPAIQPEQLPQNDYPVHLVHVFPAEPGGGNPAPIVVDADGMPDDQMQSIASSYGHESGFVQSAPAGSAHDYTFRFWVPNHEMSMCGHATVGAVWLLDRLGMLGEQREHLSIWTRSGVVHARLSGDPLDRTVEITQPRGTVDSLPDDVVPEILDVLGITAADLAQQPVQNAQTSRVKTLIPVADVSVLDGLQPRYDRIEKLCDLLASTGLYPYAPSTPGRQVFDARQFPRSSGYPEDAATGIAAAALAYGLLANGLVDPGRPVHVRQGRAMGRPSEITLRFAGQNTESPTGQDGLWLSGKVT